MELLFFLEKGLWYGIAALGFAVLFKAPPRVLPAVFVAGSLGGLVRLIALQLNLGIILATLMGATLIGFFSIILAHKKHAPPIVFAVPSVIPMVPGILAYQMMLGLISLAGEVNHDTYLQVLSQTINNGLKVMLILMSLAGGVAIPMLLTRKNSAKNIRFRTILGKNE